MRAALVAALSLGHWATGPLGHSVAWAAVPRTLNYQGKLTLSDGTPMKGEHAVLFRLYDAASGGAKLWEEQHQIQLDGLDVGIFSVVLGSHIPFPAGMVFNEPLWLTLEVDGGGEFSPRQILSSVTYALNADRLDGLDSAELLAASGSGDITAVTAGAGLTGGATSGDATLDVGAGTGILVDTDAISVDVGTSAGKIVQLDDDGALPAVSGANLTNLPVGESVLGSSIESAEVTDGTLTAADTAATFLTAGSGVTITKGADSWDVAAVGAGGDITSVTAGAGLTGGGTSGDVTLDIGAGTGLLVAADVLSVDVGTTAGKLVQLDGTGALPAVSGANLTGLNASNLATGTVPDARLSANVSLLGSSVGAGELEADSVGASALSATAIQAGDIEVGDLPAHAGTHQPGGSDALPTAGAVSVALANSAGTSTSLSRADHAHQGLHSLKASGQSEIVGDATLSAGSNITLSQSGSAITIAASGSGSPSCLPLGGSEPDGETSTFSIATFGGGDRESDADQIWPVPVAGTISQFQAHVNNAPGSGDSWTVTVRKNGSNTVLSCVIANSAQSCTDTDAVSVATGDRVGVKFVEQGSAAGTDGSGWSACLVPD